jgi:hypothetical protein
VGPMETAIRSQSSLRIALSKESTRLGAFLYLKTEAKPASETLYCFKTGRGTSQAKEAHFSGEGDISYCQRASSHLFVSASMMRSKCLCETVGTNCNAVFCLREAVDLYVG